MHHIVPTAAGGPDTLDNAAPLCQNCHDRFGDNPQKHKEITQMRDWWYEVVLEKWPTSSYREQRLNDAVVRSADDPVAAKAVIEELSRGLDRLKAMLDRPSAQTIRSVATGLVTATRLGENVHANVRCSRCGSSVGLLVGQSACPTCAEPIRY